jgi:hypothetical protein
MTEPQQDQEEMDKASHEYMVSHYSGKASKGLAEWQGDLSAAIDVWLLREFDAWSRSKKTTFTVKSVDIGSWWEKDLYVEYSLGTTYAGSLDADLAQQATIVLEATVYCGSKRDPTSFEFKLGIIGSAGVKVVYTSVGIVLTRTENRRLKSFRISANGQPHQCRL